MQANRPDHQPISLLRGLLMVGAALALFVVADLAIGSVQPEPPSLAEQLPVPLESGDVYLLGNSMFKTGIDVEHLQALLPAESVKFSYHDGYYSNLWYLMAKNAIVPSDQRPSILVWGFRPTYAIQPAFQKRDSPDITTFRLEEEPFWEDVVSSRGRVPIPVDDSFINEVGRASTIHSGRTDFQQWVQRRANNIDGGRCRQ